MGITEFKTRTTGRPKYSDSIGKKRTTNRAARFRFCFSFQVGCACHKFGFYLQN